MAQDKMRPGDRSLLNEVLTSWETLSMPERADFLQGLLRAALTSRGQAEVHTWLRERLTGMGDLRAALAQIDLVAALAACPRN